MNDSTTLIHQKRVLPACAGFNRLSLCLILFNGIKYSLCEFRFYFCRCNRNAIDKEHKVKGFVSCGLIVYLMHDTENV